MKIKLEIDVPPFKWVDVPTLYRTPIGDFTDIRQVNIIKDLIEYLQRLPEIEWIINSNHQHVRHVFCRELVRNRLNFVKETDVWNIGEALSHFLMRFREMSGYNFLEYKFKYSVLSNGKKIQFESFSMMFDTEIEALRHMAKIHTSGNDFEFDVFNDAGKQLMWEGEGWVLKNS